MDINRNMVNAFKTGVYLFSVKRERSKFKPLVRENGTNDEVWYDFLIRSFVNK